MGNKKLTKSLKKRSKDFGIVKPDIEKGILELHEKLISDGQKAKQFQTNTRILFREENGLKAKCVLENLGIIKKGDFVARDYNYFPSRMEQMSNKLKELKCLHDIWFSFGRIDETVLMKQIKKPLLPAKSNSFEELKQNILNCGPAVFYDKNKTRYSSRELIRTNPILYQDVNGVLSSIENTHETDKHMFWCKSTLLGEQKLGNFEFLGVAAGSDCELPTFFIIYLDQDGDIRGYVPRKGNAIGIPTVKKSNIYNWEEIKKDILGNIQVI